MVNSNDFTPMVISGIVCSVLGALVLSLSFNNQPLIFPFNKVGFPISQTPTIRNKYSLIIGIILLLTGMGLSIKGMVDVSNKFYKEHDI